MKKYFFALSLLFSVPGARAVDINFPAVAVGAVTALGLHTASQWKNNPNADGILTTAGKPFGLTGRGVLQVANTAGSLATLALIFPSIKETAITAGGFGPANIAVQSLLNGANQNESPINTEKTVRWVGAGAVLNTVYQNVPAVTTFMNGLSNRK